MVTKKELSNSSWIIQWLDAALLGQVYFFFADGHLLQVQHLLCAADAAQVYWLLQIESCFFFFFYVANQVQHCLNCYWMVLCLSGTI